MATQSDSPPPAPVVDDKTHNTALPAAQARADNRQDATAEAAKESSPTSVFKNSEPIREEQVQNAVKFLSHPRVQGSPVMYRRSFLERKGLTKEEIDEAFRRVPDPTPAVSTTPPVASNQDGQLKSSSNIQQQAPSQVLQPASAAHSKLGMLSQFHWYHAILAIGVLAASGAGTAVFFKKSIIPRLKSWIRKVVLEEEDEEGETFVKKRNSTPSLAEEAAAAAKSAAAAAADVARASQEMLISKTEEEKYFGELTKLLDTQIREMKSMSTAIQKLEGQSNVSGRVPIEEQDDYRIPFTGSRQPYANGKAEVDSRSVRSLSPTPPVEPSVAPHPKSYMEIMAMVQRGEKPSNIKEINDLPPNPNQPVPDPRLAPRLKPWEVNQNQNTSGSAVTRYQESIDSFSGSQDNQFSGDSSTPWWQRKNVRITEIETEGEQKMGSTSFLANERPVQRSWVPPQPPPVAMPEAAAAIRQPKKQKDQLTDDQLLTRSSDISDDLQRVTRFSESGGVMEANGGSSELNNGAAETNPNGGSLGPNTSEIQNEEGSYVEA